MARPERSRPRDSRYSAASLGSSSASSASTSAHTGIASTPPTSGAGFERASSSTFATYKMGFIVSKKRSWAAACSSSVISMSAARLPSFSHSCRRFATERRGCKSLSRLASFSNLGSARSNVPRSAKISSVWIISTSCSGSTRPSTCTTSGSEK